MVRAITTAAVIPAAKVTIRGYVDAQIIPTRRLNISVNTNKIGNPYFLVVVRKHPITHDITINKTESIMIAGVLTNIFLKVGEFIAQTHIKTVMINCILNNV
jgi:hypothetical protein